MPPSIETTSPTDIEPDLTKLTKTLDGEVDKKIIDSSNGATLKKRSESVDLSKQMHLKQQFMSDEDVAKSWIFNLFMLFQLRVQQLFHGFKVVGAEKLPKDGALMVGFHSTHNQDVVTGVIGMYDATGRVPRGLLHRMVFLFNPWVGYLGLVPGQRKTAVQLLRKGFLVGVLPGGGEEAMYGHEHAYDLHPRWNDRKGFAYVAREAEVPIVPIFTKNIEEMRFNLIFWILNILGFTRMYARFLAYLTEQSKLKPKSMFWKRSAWIVKQLGLVSWFMLSWVLSFWVPVQTTMYVGEPIIVKKDDDVIEIARKAREGLQAMIDEHQPHGHSYWPGVVERYNNVFPTKEIAVSKKTN